MKKRPVIDVLVLTALTFGVYALYWHIKTKREMVEQGADIPTAWLLLVPIGNIYWYWKWCGGVEYVTRGRTSALLVLMLGFAPSFLAVPVIQDVLNRAIDDMPNRLPSLPQARIV